MDKFNCLSYCILRDGRISGEVSQRIRTTHDFSNLKYQWRERDVRLSIKDAVQMEEVKSTMINKVIESR